jgi:hypothetical protein
MSFSKETPHPTNFLKFKNTIEENKKVTNDNE